MSKILKYGLLGIVALLVLALGAVAILAATFDPNKYKGEIERLAREKTGRTLKLAGDLKLAFWPSIGAKVAGVSLSERDPAQEFVALESAHISMRLMPLLRGEAIVDTLTVTGLKANVVKGKDGKFNFDDLVDGQAKKPEAKPAPEKKGGGEQVKFDISGVKLERSAVSYRDLQKGGELALSEVNLSTGRIADKADGKLTLGAVAKGKNPDLDVKVEMSSDYAFDLAAKAFSLSKLDAKLTGAAAGMKGLQVGAKGDVAANPQKNEYKVSGLNVDFKAAQAKDTIEGKLAAPSLVITADTAKGDAVSAEFRMKGENRSAEAVVKLSGVQGSAKALVVPQLSADVSLASPDLPMKSLKLPITGSLRADLEKQTASADLSTRFDESSIKAKLGLAKFTPPSYLFDVAVDRLNLDKYLPPEEKPAASGAAKPAAGGAQKADTPVDLSPIKDLNANGKLAVGSLQARGLKLSDVRAEVKAGGGRLDIAPHSAKLYDGSVSGALTLHADNRVAVKENMSGVAIGPLLRDFAKQDRLDGKGNVALDVTAAGKTVDAMKKALNGTAKVNLKDGAIKGIDIAAVLRKAKSIVPGGQTPAQAGAATEKTDFSEMNATFVIKNGVARNDDLDVKAPIFRLGGAGNIDVGNSQLDYLAKASVVATAKGQGGADLASLAGITIPVKLTGPFEDPKYTVDYGAVAAGLAKSRVGDAIKERLGGGGGAAGSGGASKGGSVGDRLKGLFGR